MKFPSEGGQDFASQEKDTIVETIICPVDEPVASVDAETFDSRYEQVERVARTEFGADMGKRRQFQREAREGASIDRDYVVEELGEVASSVENTDQQQTLAQFQDIVETVSADRILGELRDLRKQEVTGEELVTAIREIISRYNLQDVNPRSSTLRSLFNDLNSATDSPDIESSTSLTSDSSLHEKIESELEGVQGSSEKSSANQMLEATDNDVPNVNLTYLIPCPEPLSGLWWVL
jgi:hypothetical protein